MYGFISEVVISLTSITSHSNYCRNLRISDSNYCLNVNPGLQYQCVFSCCLMYVYQEHSRSVRIVEGNTRACVALLRHEHRIPRDSDQESQMF